MMRLWFALTGLIFLIGLGCGQAQAQVAVSAGDPPVVVTPYEGGCLTTSPCTVANVLSGSPCQAGRVGHYAVVSDLYSGTSNTNEVLRCTLSGSTYYWRPQRTDFAGSVATTGGTVTYTCFVTPPTMFTSGTLLSNATLTLATTNCWPGATFTIANGNTLGIFGVTVTGLVGGLTKTLGLGGVGVFTYDGTVWRPSY